MIELKPDARVFVAGHRGLVGSAIVRRLEAEGFSQVLTATRERIAHAPSHLGAPRGQVLYLHIGEAKLLKSKT
jgi:nucleoside-diphosphate-sugar epimerase